MGNVADQLQRAFAGFAPIAKRNQTTSAIEIDLAKVATDIAKAAVGYGPSGDVAELEKTVDAIGAFLESVTHDPASDMILAPSNEVSKRYVVDKADDLGSANLPPANQEGQYNVDHGSGRAVPPKKGSKEQREMQYTAGSGIADDTTESYLDSSTESVGEAPSGGKPGTSFDQPAGGPNTGTKKGAPAPTAKRVKAAPPAHDDTPGNAEMTLDQEDPQGSQAGMVSEGFALSRGGGKKSSTKKAAAEEPEERWARDMAEEVVEMRKAASKKKAAPPVDDEGDDDEEAPADATDDKSSADAKRKAAKKAAGKAKAQGGADPAETVDDLEDEDREADAAAASKPNTGGDPDETVDDVGAGKARTGKGGKAKAQTNADPSGAVDEPPTDEDDEEPAKKKTAKGKPFPGAAKPFGAKGKPAKDDEDDDEEPAKKAAKPKPDAEDSEDEADGGDDEEAEGEGKKPWEKAAKTKKSAEDDGEEFVDLEEEFNKNFSERDLSPAVSPTGRLSRMTKGEVPRRAQDARQHAEKAASIRKAALEAPASGLSPDQIAYLAKSAAKSPEQKRRERAKALKEKGYAPGQGYQPGMIDGVDAD